MSVDIGSMNQPVELVPEGVEHENSLPSGVATHERTAVTQPEIDGPIDSDLKQFRDTFESNSTEQADTTSPTSQSSQSPCRSEMISGAVSLAGWFMFFSGGLFIPTLAYREQLLKANGFGEFLGHIGYLIVILGCYTLTNLLFLSCLSAYLGCMAFRWRITARDDGSFQLYAGVPPVRIYAAAVLRGFFLYLVVISGLLTFSTESSIVNTDFSQYIRLAGIVSALAFTIGYDPQLIKRLLGSLEDFANQPLRSQPRNTD